MMFRRIIQQPAYASHDKHTGPVLNASDLDALMSCLKKEERDFGVDNGVDGTEEVI